MINLNGRYTLGRCSTTWPTPPTGRYSLFFLKKTIINFDKLVFFNSFLLKVQVI
jgi:hypothetical protein